MRVEIGVTRIQVRGPRIQIGNILVQTKEMGLVNVQTFRSQGLASKQVLSVPQIDYLCAQIEK